MNCDERQSQIQIIREQLSYEDLPDEALWFLTEFCLKAKNTPKERVFAGKDVEEEMFLQYEKMVFYIINHHTHPKDRDDDMEQEGRMGLLDAIRTYREEKGGFYWWAYPVIKNRVCSEVNRRSRDPRLNNLHYSINDKDYIRGPSTVPRIDLEDDFEFLLTFARPKEASILKRLSGGESSEQIGVALGVTAQRIRHYKKEGVQRILSGIHGRNYQKELRPHSNDE